MRIWRVVGREMEIWFVGFETVRGRGGWARWMISQVSVFGASERFWVDGGREKRPMGGDVLATKAW